MDPALRAWSCQLRLHARRQIDFSYPASNRLRGALGFLLDSQLFRPEIASAPSGLHDPPRAFSLRASALDGRRVEAGERFEIELMVYWLDPEPWIEALSELEWAMLEDVQIHELVFDLQPVDVCSQLRVEFLTPTELKPISGALPEFGVLFARSRDRVAALRRFHGPGPLDADYRGLGERAQNVTAIDGRIDWVKAERTSRRSGQTHPLGGFTGWVDYAGELGEFVPWLRAVEATGVGRQTVWGKGRIRVSV